MLTRIRQWCTPTVFEGDKDKSRVGKLVNILLGVFFISSLGYWLLVPVAIELRMVRVALIVTVLLVVLVLKQLLNQSLRRIDEAFAKAQRELNALKQTEEELRESEERYRAVVENQTEFIVRWEPDGTRTFVNDAYCRYFDLTYEQAISTSFLPLIVEEDRVAMGERIGRLMSGTANTETYVHRVIKPDGSIGWQEWTDKVIRDAAGQVVEFLSVGRDVTERKISEQALRESEEKFRALVAHLPNAAIYLDSPNPAIGTYYISPQIKEMLGYSPEEWVASPTSWPERIYPEDREQVLAADARHDASGEPFSQDYRMITHSGNVVWIRDQGAIVLDDAGQPRFSLGIMIDITERKRAEENLIQFRRVIDESNDAVFMIDPETGLYLDFNKKAYEFLGYGRDELSRLSITEIALHIPNINIWHERVALVRETGSLIFEAVYRRKDKTTFPVEVSARMLNYGGREILVAIVRDITERKRADEELRRSEEKFRQLITSAPDAIIGANQEGRIIFASVEATTLLGYELEELMNMNIEALVPARFRAAHTAKYANYMTNPNPRMRAGLELFATRKDGSEVPVDINLSRLDTQAGSLVTAFIRDITVRKQAEEALTRQVNELTVLHSVALAAVESNSENEIIEKVTSITSQIYKEVCGILLLNESGNVLVPHPPYFGADLSNWMDGYPITQGITGRAVRSGKAVRLDDITKEPDYIEIASGIRSELCVPISVHENIIGIFNVESKHRSAFSEADERLLTTIAGQLSNALERQRGESALRQRADQMSALYNMGIAISSNLAMEQILNEILKAALQLVANPQDAHIFLYSSEEDLLTFGAALMADGQAGKLFGQPRKNGLTYQVAHSGKLLVVPDIHNHPIYKDALPEWEGSIIGLPLKRGERIVGVMNVAYELPREFSENEIQLLSLVATHAASAIENARLFQSEQIRRQEAETLRESLASIVTTFDLEEVVERILDQIKYVIPYDTASVWRVDGEWLKPIVGRDIPSELALFDMKLRVDGNHSSQGLIQGKKSFILSNNVQEELPDFRGPHSYINSWLAVPLKTRGKIIGQIGLDGKRKGQFTAHHAELAVTFADQVAIALENASLYEEMEQELAERQRAETSLRQSEERYRAIFENATEGIFQTMPDGRNITANPAVARILGYDSPEEYLSAVPNIVALYVDTAQRAEFRRAMDERGETRDFEVRVYRKSGEQIWVSLHARAMHDARDNLLFYEGFVRDITEQKQAEEEIQQLNADLENRVEERTTQLNEANQNLHHEKARLEQYSRQRELMATMTDLLQASLTTDEASSIVSTHMQLLFPNRDGALYLLNSSGALEPIAIWGEQRSMDTIFGMNDCWALRRGKTYRFGRSSLNPPCAHVGSEIPQSALCIPLTAQGESLGSLHISTENVGEGGLIEDEEGRFIETITDSVALALANLRLRERLRNQTIRDPLTGIFNRRFMEETLEREVHRAGRNQLPLCVIMFEIDDFKQYNNSFGHDAGDYVLKKVTDTMSSRLRRSDFPCRYGGDEFTLILPETTLEDGAHRAEELRKAVEALALSYNNQALGQVTVRMGVAVYPKHGATGEAILKVADDASYRARAIGKNCVVIAD